ncbi:hypothetical protein CFOL_v3_14658 [Cephalotus follicularis]|uniref:Uncharacterized protein n=1 Tax=Cephalotus follicularis TaxID=3775 RepID=A0A1Q3BT74_CEPFO|nr:hypothetical protein CFOL_v3_14658 [Cephalotus follicularis]
MARLLVVSLIVALILVIQAVADKSGDLGMNPVGDKVQSRYSVVYQPAPSPDDTKVTEAPVIRRLGRHRSDRSVAGGGVIIGGLVTTIFAAVFCYIRVTRRRGGVH